jgi:hypothetical protein
MDNKVKIYWELLSASASFFCLPKRKKQRKRQASRSFGIDAASVSSCAFPLPKSPLSTELCGATPGWGPRANRRNDMRRHPYLFFRFENF